MRRDLVQDRPFTGDGPWEDVVEGGYAVAGHHDQKVLTDGINIPDFSTIKGRLVWKLELGLAQRCHVVNGQILNACPDEPSGQAFVIHHSLFVIHHSSLSFFIYTPPAL
jgi:hypothetical protein